MCLVIAVLSLPRSVVVADGLYLAPGIERWE
jgi:hypothetical protein